MTIKRYGLVAGLFLALAVLLLASGCGVIGTAKVGPLQTEEQSVERNDADSVQAEINLGAGKLTVSGGASSLLDATFTYNVAEWEPEVEYDVSSGEGDLTISQPTVRERNTIPTSLKDVRYDWDLRFNDSVPMDMSVNMGAGEGDLRLDSLSIESLNFQGGAGDVSIDLSGGTARNLDFTLGAGEVEIDLSGRWDEDLSANVKGGVGKLTFLLPSSSGVRVQVQGGLGSVSAVGLSKDGNIYTNDAYGDSDVTLDIDIEGGIGEINLEIVE